MKAQIGVRRGSRMTLPRRGELARALRAVPGAERAVREVSRMLREAGIRHLLVGALAANAYRDRPRTTEDVDFLVGDEAFETHGGGFVTLRVPVIEFDGLDVDQVPLTGGLRVVESAFDRAHVSEGVPIAPVDVIVVMKLLAGRTQDHADIEAIAESGTDREALRAVVRESVPDRLPILERLFANVDART
jgi:hypothetical protein